MLQVHRSPDEHEVAGPPQEVRVLGLDIQALEAFYKTLAVAVFIFERLLYIRGEVYRARNSTGS